MYGRLNAPQRQYWLCGEEKRLLPQHGFEPFLIVRPAFNLVPVLSELSRIVEVGEENVIVHADISHEKEQL
jgi:hypothetical protein